MRRAVHVPAIQPIVIGAYTLMETSLVVRGRPSYEQHVGVGDFIQRAHHASGFWLGDWLRYGDSRTDWQDRIDQAINDTGLAEKTLKNVRAVAAIEQDRRRGDLEFGIHEAVAALSAAEQTRWLDKAAEHGWNVRELRLELRASRRRRIIEGQAVLEGLYRVVYADPDWEATDPAEIAKWPIAAHVERGSVLFLWVPPSKLIEASSVLAAWSYGYMTGLVWDGVLGCGGVFANIRHVHLLVATRGQCPPEVPNAVCDSVQVIRRSQFDAEKPDEFRRMIERLYPHAPKLAIGYHGPWEGWTMLGTDPQRWVEDATREERRERVAGA
jgi:N6-adenosine-specific RNA methylase IME4